jgi:hypothetical protein
MDDDCLRSKSQLGEAGQEALKPFCGAAETRPGIDEEDEPAVFLFQSRLTCP